jgi:hypothetical protein
MGKFNPYLAAGGGLASAGLGSLFADYENPADAAMPYFNKASNALDKYMSPYINRGNRAGDVLEGEYGSLVNNPGEMINRIGGNYQQSPGFKFALQQALQGSRNAAASSGMAGSPQHEQQNMEIATGLANEDFNNWIRNALGLFGQGLGGEESMYGTGAKAGIGMGEDLATMLQNQAKLAYEGQNAENQRSGGMFGNLLGGAGMIAGSMIGGPPGAAAGSALSRVFI